MEGVELLHGPAGNGVAVPRSVHGELPGLWILVLHGLRREPGHLVGNFGSVPFGLRRDEQDFGTGFFGSDHEGVDAAEFSRPRAGDEEVAGAELGAGHVAQARGLEPQMEQAHREASHHEALAAHSVQDDVPPAGQHDFSNQFLRRVVPAHLAAVEDPVNLRQRSGCHERDGRRCGGHLRRGGRGGLLPELAILLVQHVRNSQRHWEHRRRQ
ncbi:hypothetical protein Mapa_005798 [Marchantia paleacea]|nr:hypothetical protein Mapa_005798 [Marchantia paleacea]